MKTYKIGLDIGGTKILSVLYDENHKIINSVKILTQAHLGRDIVLKNILESINQVLENNNSVNKTKIKIQLNHVKKLGVALPGFVNKNKKFIEVLPNISSSSQRFFSEAPRSYTGNDRCERKGRKGVEKEAGRRRRMERV